MQVIPRALLYGPTVAVCLLSTAVTDTRAAPVVGSPGSRDLEVVVDRTELRWSSTGRLLGHLNRGTELERLGGRDGWTRVGVSGWMWRPSLAPQGGNTLRVTPRRENLRASPNGAILGTLERGVEVRRVATEGRWLRIEMIGWLPDRAVRDTGTQAPAATETPADDASPPAEPARRAAAGRLADATPLRLAPGGDEVAGLPDALPVEVVETRGAWTRIRIDGWVASGAVDTSLDAASDPVAVAVDPERHAGRRVTWTLEYVSMQRADDWRTDFESGETYALMRVPDDRARYVYLVVAPTHEPAFKALAPFERVRVRGTIRNPRSALTGNPIVVVEEVLP